MSEKPTGLLPSPKHEDIHGDQRSRRQMSSNLPSFNMPTGARPFSPSPGFDHKSEQPQLLKYPTSNGASGNSMPAPGQGQQSGHEYGQQNQSGTAQGSYNNGLGYWPAASSSGAQGQGQVPFPNQQNPTHLPSLYPQGQNYTYPPRSAGASMPRSGSPHGETSSAALPPPAPHDGYPQQQHAQHQPQQQHPGGPPGNAGSYGMYTPGYGGGPNQGPGNMYGGSGAGGYGNYPSQPYGGSAAVQQQQYGGLYAGQMPHSREASQDASQWQRSPYGPAAGYPNQGYAGQYAQGMPPSAPQVQYPPGSRPGRGPANTGERPFKCDECPQSFQRSHDLKRHKRIHLAVKPFPCPSCDKSFSRKDALKRHILVKGCGNSEP